MIVFEDFREDFSFFYGVMMLQVIVADLFEIFVKNDILASYWTFVLLKLQTHFLN